MAVSTGRIPSGVTAAARGAVGRRTRRIGVALFFASVIVNAAIGIYAILAPAFGDTQARVLGTSLCVTGAALIALACEPAWERGALAVVPQAAALLGGLGFALAIAELWAQPGGDAWPKAAVTILTVAAAGAVASLLALARLAPRHLWVRRVTFALLAVGTVFYGALPWFEDPAEGFLRAFGVVMIALAAFVVTVPVVHWLDRGALAAADVVTGDVRFCPYCGRGVTGAVDAELSCARCGRGFRVAEASVDGSSSSNLT